MNEVETLWAYWRAAEDYRRELETRIDTGILFPSYDKAHNAFIKADFAVRDLHDFDTMGYNE